MMRRQTLRKLWLCGLLAYLGVIALASLLPPPELPLSPGGFDKLWHGGAYAVAAFSCVPLWRRWPSLLLAGLALVAYGLLMEVLQGWSGQRSYDLMDALANSSGVALGLLAGCSALRGVLAAPRI